MQASTGKAPCSSWGPWSSCDSQMQISGPPGSLQLSGPMDACDSQRRGLCPQGGREGLPDPWGLSDPALGAQCSHWVLSTRPQCSALPPDAQCLPLGAQHSPRGCSVRAPINAITYLRKAEGPLPLKIAWGRVFAPKRGRGFQRGKGSHPPPQFLPP